MTIYDYIWQYMTIYDYIGLHIWLLIVLYMTTYMTIYDCIHTWLYWKKEDKQHKLIKIDYCNICRIIRCHIL